MLVKYFIVALIFMIRFLKNGKSTLSFHGKLTPKHNGIIMHVIFKYVYAIQFVDNAFGPKSSDEINLKLTVKLQFQRYYICEKKTCEKKKKACILFCRNLVFKNRISLTTASLKIVLKGKLHCIFQKFAIFLKRLVCLYLFSI